MYKPPSEQNEQPDGENGREAANSASPVRPRQNATPRKGAEKPSRPFYADEHPEIPRIRRASLKQARVDMLPTTDHGVDNDSPPAQSRTNPNSRPLTQKKRPTMHPFTGLQNEQEREEPEERTVVYPRAAAKQRRAEMLPFTGLEKEYPRVSDTEKHEKLVQSGKTTRKNGAQTTGMHRLTTRSARRVQRTISAPFWQRRKGWLLIGLLALLLLVLTPFMVGIVHNLTNKQKGHLNNSASSVSISKLQSVPSNSHELVIVPPKTDHPAPPVMATSAYLLDADNETTLDAQNPFLHLPMLSTTKLMTATIAVETGNLDQQITITPAMEQDINHLSADSALFGVKVGETYSLRDLLYGLLYVSGNDAALVIADALAGSVPAFVTEMNQKAQILGLNDTHFVNPHGLLDPGQYSCARDLAVLGQYALGIPVLHQISSGRVYHIAAGGKHGARVLLNENQFLWWYPGVDGGKTGYDGASDFVQVMSVTRNGHHLIAVAIHTNNWWTDMRDLINYGFNNYTWVSPRDVEASGQPIPYDSLWNYFASDTPTVSVSNAPNTRYYVFSGYSISGAILTYFDKNGGLKKFGYPMKIPVPSGDAAMSQQFQHGSILCNLTNNQCSTM